MIKAVREHTHNRETRGTVVVRRTTEGGGAGATQIEIVNDEWGSCVGFVRL